MKLVLKDNKVIAIHENNQDVEQLYPDCKVIIDNDFSGNVEDEYILTPEKEKECIATLSLTRGDVFRALLKAKGVTRAQLREMIVNNETLSDIERELALIDFDEALEFYRGVELINILGAALGFSTKQLDDFFKTNDYTKLVGE